MKFGEKIRLLREEKGLSQREVAEKLNVSLRTYASYELNQRRPRTESKWQEIAAFFGKDVDYLQIDDIDEKAAILERYRIDEIRLRYSRFEADVSNTIIPFLQQLGWSVEKCTRMESHYIADLVATLNNIRILFEFKFFSVNRVPMDVLHRVYGLASTIPIDKRDTTYFFVVSNTKKFKELAERHPSFSLNMPIKFFTFNQESKKFDSPELFRIISSLSQ